MTRKILLWLPLALGLALFVAFYAGLDNSGETIVQSNVVGQEVPDFDLPAANALQPGTSAADFTQGKPRLINVFASWCVPCVSEIPVLQELHQQGVEIGGIAIHDTPGALAQFLAANGNPYTTIGMDNDGKVQIAIGSSGVPETFVIDGKGKILYQHIGVVTDRDVPMLLSMMRGTK